MSVRLAVWTDMPVLLEIYDQARSYMRRHGNMEQWADGHPNRDDLSLDIRKDRLYVYEVDGEVEGSFVFYIGADPTYQKIAFGHWLNDESYGVLHKVASRQRMKGIGHEIIMYAFSQTHNVRMDTHIDNHGMQRLLERHNFQHVGTIYLADGQSRLAYHHV